MTPQNFEWKKYRLEIDLTVKNQLTIEQKTNVLESLENLRRLLAIRLT